MKSLHHWLLFVTPEDLKNWRELNGYSQMKLAAALRVSRVDRNPVGNRGQGNPVFPGSCPCGVGSNRR